MKKVLLAIVSLLVFAAQISATPSEADVKRLREIQQNILALERIVQQGHPHQQHPQIESVQRLTADEFHYASRITGEEITTKEQLAQYLLVHDKTGGFFTFLNIVWFLASIIVIIALCWLCAETFGSYSIEILGYVLCILGLVSGAIFPSIGIWFVVPACLLLVGLLLLTQKLHFTPKPHDYEDREGKAQVKPGSHWLEFSFFQVEAAILTVVYAACALYYHSSVLGFMAVMALESLLGFTVIVAPFCIGMGFKSNNVVPRATVASFLILLAYLSVRINDGNYGPFVVFETGAFFVGTFVYFLGLLILSSWYYYSWSHRATQDKNSQEGTFWVMQVVTIASGCAALYIGSVFGISTLLGVGGTLFVIYLLEKYSELPWNKIGLAWGLLGAGALLFGFALFAYHHPQYFFLGAG